MEVECKVPMNVSDNTEADQPTTMRGKPSSKLTAAMLAVILCLATAAAALLFFNSHAKHPEVHEDSFHLKLRQIANVRAAIHLGGEFNASLKDSIQWMAEVDQYHSQGGLKLDNNEIVIPRNGLYFVYSQASFAVSCSGDSTANSMVHLSHTVQRWSSSYGTTDNKVYRNILHSVRTACQRAESSEQDGSGHWYSAVYMGAVFNLRRGDRLRTVMDKNMLEQLEDDPGKTFFGVFAL
ncbi:tumor necrosis factor a (TNF superfamily, member 2) [Oryzias melastigma]|uniref:Lymphotoxin-alpha n=1 Tax=Oryzias melastigma TaxID=30732 RepID=A0A3B3BP94_ORYME|nr:tumor necrosis factor a (TNF superfamily, member 2) [Oryzias melastigma]